MKRAAPYRMHGQRRRHVLGTLASVEELLNQIPWDMVDEDIAAAHAYIQNLYKSIRGGRRFSRYGMANARGRIMSILHLVSTVWLRMATGPRRGNVSLAALAAGRRLNLVAAGFCEHSRF